jgi:hypothetical protein
VNDQDQSLRIAFCRGAIALEGLTLYDIGNGIARLRGKGEDSHGKHKNAFMLPPARRVRASIDGEGDQPPAGKRAKPAP